YFFLYSYVAHLDLPSFPTRRSSDLFGMVTAFVLTITLLPALVTLMGVRRGVQERGVALLAQADGLIARRRAMVLAAFAVLGLVSDRKSTRLNSSHSQISYAVFCLKK